MAVRMKNQLFSDDVTIAFFENRYSIPYDSNPYEKQNVTERIFVDEITESLAELDKAMGEEMDMKDLEKSFSERELLRNQLSYLKLRLQIKNR